MEVRKPHAAKLSIFCCNLENTKSWLDLPQIFRFLLKYFGLWSSYRTLHGSHTSWPNKHKSYYDKCMTRSLK